MKSKASLALAAFVAAASSAPAGAEIVLSQLVVEIAPGKAMRGDVEVWNNDSERAYVLVEPAEVLEPGTSTERRVGERDPQKLGLLITPVQMVLEPGQRKLLRISSVVPTGSRERVYRITVKPTVGSVQSNVTGLKLLIGYDVLVLVRPGDSAARLSGSRNGKQLTIRNNGAASVELAAGKACRGKADCRELPAKRLYAGAALLVDAAADETVDYAVVTVSGSTRQTF
jgi:P pilus assembly chaperone PapD